VTGVALSAIALLGAGLIVGGGALVALRRRRNIFTS
jgi:LPXTG-motif cell wall-anchored protein